MAEDIDQRFVDLEKEVGNIRSDLDELIQRVDCVIDAIKGLYFEIEKS